MAPSVSTIKRLFAVSRNQCAFLGCINTLIDEHTGTVTGEICHIKAKKPKGARFNLSQTDEQRDNFDNLMMMCPIHHKVIDGNPRLYTGESLIEMKIDHESGGDPIKEPTNQMAALFLEPLIAVENLSITSHQQQGGQTAAVIVNQGTGGVQDKREQLKAEIFSSFFNPIYSDINDVLEQFGTKGYHLGYSRQKYDELRRKKAFHLKKYGDNELLRKIDDFYAISDERQKHRELYPEKANKIINQCVESIGRTKSGKWNIDKKKAVYIDVKFHVINNEGKIEEKDVNLSFDVLFLEIGISLLRGGVNREILDFSRVLLHRDGGKALDISYCWSEIYDCIKRKAKVDGTLKYLRDSVKMINILGTEILTEIETEFSE